MHVQIIHHQGYLFCAFVLTSDFFNKTSPVPLGFSFGDFYRTLPYQWLARNENIADAATLVFIVVLSRLPWRCRNWNLCFTNQLLWGFVHAYNRIKWIERALVNIQYHFHIRHKAAVLLRWNYPPLVLPGLNFVFFKMRRTDS